MLISTVEKNEVGLCLEKIGECAATLYRMASVGNTEEAAGTMNVYELPFQAEEITVKVPRQEYVESVREQKAIGAKGMSCL